MSDKQPTYGLMKYINAYVGRKVKNFIIKP